MKYVFYCKTCDMYYTEYAMNHLCIVCGSQLIIERCED